MTSCQNIDNSVMGILHFPHLNKWRLYLRTILNNLANTVRQIYITVGFKLNCVLTVSILVLFDSKCQTKFELLLVISRLHNFLKCGIRF